MIWKQTAGAASAFAVLTCAMLVGVATASAASPIRFGVQAPITGPYADEGQGIEKAVRLLAEQQNAKGGLLGRQIEVTVCDDEGKPSQAAICARQLVNAKVVAVIGSYTSGAALAAEPIYAAADVLQTSDGTSNKLSEQGFKTWFGNAAPNSAEAEFTANYLVNVRAFKRIAVLTDHSSFATGLADEVIKNIAAVHGNVVEKAFVNADSQNFTPVLTKLKSLNPDVLYYSGYFSDGGLIRAQMQQLGMDAAFVGGDANQNVSFAKIAGAAAGGSVIVNVPAPQDLPYPAAKQFVADYKAKYGALPPSVFTLTNADGMRAILEAIEATKGTEPAALENHLHHLVDFQGLTGTFAWNERGERTGSPFVAFEVQADGAYKILYPEPAK
ncbi:branched-chain amino acid ABC transporter substrate-binding protein [Telmatospirillum siberiense]|uniref:Branched-chain amino acid ABC transporter substrate-binding protein n=1 Tax=Telmatospirillum siberiense TaxID=382514 RepID=A0A2N3PWC2_9PROT|nr:branched-chain amino acid ABC transporter substrate-binding protein [Telmatospirillum siberiense]PKU24678.1 branched-chain amino acid ABC transporter substrate-binding protein [Telmatospirillum siberiense]